VDLMYARVPVLAFHLLVCPALASCLFDLRADAHDGPANSTRSPKYFHAQCAVPVASGSCVRRLLRPWLHVTAIDPPF
jgi:hypothetical protein